MTSRTTVRNVAAALSLAATCAVVGPSAHAAILFDQRANENVVKSDLTTLTASAGSNPQALVGRMDGAWQNTGGSVPTPTVLTIDLGKTRNMEVI